VENGSAGLGGTTTNLSKAAAGGLIRPSVREIAVGSAVGAVGAGIYLFAFPAGAISTLMHAVLRLPGPGAGIAMVVGPFLVLAAMSSFFLTGARGTALIASVAFGICHAFIIRLLHLPTNPKAGSSAAFLAALVVFGLCLEAVMAAGRPRGRARRCLLAGTLSNAALLVFYWFAIFPQTTGWVRWRDVPLLAAVCLAAGFVSGYVAGVLSRVLPGAFVTRQGG